MLENGAALFINGCSIFKLENGAAPFINGAQQKYMHCIGIENNN